MILPPLASSIVAWSALAIAVTVTPGPDTLLVIGHSTRHGFSAGLSAAAGIVAGGLWYVALCGFGFLSILSASPTLFTAVRIVGAIYLAWIGLRMILGAVRPTEPTEQPAALVGSPFRQGFTTNVLNPKMAVFYLAALPQFAGNGPDAPMIGMLLIAIHYAFGAVWLSCTAYAAARAGMALRRTTGMRWIGGIVGAALVGVAGKLAFDRS